jgi:mannan endo-1,4-beta-mannosidase
VIASSTRRNRTATRKIEASAQVWLDDPGTFTASLREMRSSKLTLPILVALAQLIGCSGGEEGGSLPPFTGVPPSNAPPAMPVGMMPTPGAMPPANEVPGSTSDTDLEPSLPLEPQDPVVTDPGTPDSMTPDPVIPEGNVPRPEGNLSTGFFVADGRLYDRLGADFVMRGINHPVYWFQNNALTWMEQIATTDANAVRIVWQETATSTTVLRSAIERAIELGMVPIVELHDVTGSNDLDGPARMARYYVEQTRDILDEFEPYLLINIANEWGDYFSTADQWIQAYSDAIDVLRDAGINHTLVIDANDYGQRGQTIVADGQTLLDYDPQHNILFSTHMYQAYENPQTMRDVLSGAVSAKLPLIVGEFGFQHGDRNGQPIPVPFEVMLEEAATQGIGYLAWSWTGNNDEVGYLDLSENGSASQLSGWGDDIVNGPNGIRETSEPASIFTAP